jgi:extracellular factor (EF) 3-hydroxypalmitic acid methyl ester biosynthesis protein
MVAIADAADQAIKSADYHAFGSLMLGDLDGFRRRIGDEWKDVVIPYLRDRSFFSIAQQDPFSNRSTSKPRGYAGDAVLVDFLYRSNDIGETVTRHTGAGQAIHNFWMDSPAARAVRKRRDYFTAQVIRAVNGNSKAKILVLASGHFREGEIPVSSGCCDDAAIFCLDQDVKSCDFVSERFSSKIVTVLNEKVTSILKMKENDFDLIYAAGLYDYLIDGLAMRLNAKLSTMLRSGGNLVVPNFLKSAPNRASMELLQDWFLIYRDKAEILSLVENLQDSPKGQIGYFEDDFQSIGYSVFRRA